MRRRTSGVGVLGALALAAAGVGCATPVEDPVVPQEEAKIAWFDGSYEEALEVAAAEGKPVLLYWGAEWCPPCHYLKSKVFTKPEFIEATRKVVPVYLDGDTERAQTLGETLDVAGYPTVILFAPGGGEIARLPTGLDAEDYAAALERALENTRPLGEILDEVLAVGPGAASPEDLRRVAFHSWGQDARFTDDPAGSAEILGRLWRDTPETLPAARSRFLNGYLGALRAADLEVPAEEIPAIERDVRATLTDPERREAAIDFLLYEAGATLVQLHPKPSPARDELAAVWIAAAREVGDDETLSLDDRISALFPEIQIATLPEIPGNESTAVPDDLAERVAARVAWADQQVEGGSELQTLVNTMAALLDRIGRPEAARELLLARLDQTHAPYYFMSWIAGLHREAGETGEALDWYRRAHEASRGRYSRFRWGSLYVRRQIELAPESVDDIRASAEEVLSELLQYPDAFSLGNHSRLQSLAEALEEWASEDDSRGEVLESLRGRVASECERYPAEGEDSQRTRCESFLA